jgi:hypothetical protein
LSWYASMEEVCMISRFFQGLLKIFSTENIDVKKSPFLIGNKPL